MALLVIGVIAVALLALAYLDWLLAAIIVLVAVAFLAAAALLILGGLAAIPYYFAKRGKDSEPGRYSMDQMRDPKEKERK